MTTFFTSFIFFIKTSFLHDWYSNHFACFDCLNTTVRGRLGRLCSKVSFVIAVLCHQALSFALA